MLFDVFKPGLRMCRRASDQVLHTRQALRHSLKLRLIVLFWVLALSMGLLFWAGMQKAFSIGWREAARPLLIDYVDRLTAELGTPPDPERAAALVSRLPITLHIDGPQVQWHSHPLDVGLDHPVERQQAQRILQRVTTDGHRVEWGLNAQIFAQRPRLAWWILSGLLLLTALTYAMVRRWLRPLDDIRAGVQRFGAGDFAQGIPIRHPYAPDELGQLGRSINTMGQSIHDMLEAKRSLLLAISHELRSPLTRARLHVELLPETPELQLQRNGLLQDLQGMGQLIHDLLESERLSGTHQVLQREWCDRCNLVELLTDEIHAQPDESQAVVCWSSSMPDRCHLDIQRLRVLLRNLLQNATRYGQNNAHPPHITLGWTPTPSAEHPHWGRLDICLRDFGPGVDPAQLDFLAQAFYRPDSARSREAGGVGLGLYLCRLIAQAHGGHLILHNAHPGLSVQVCLYGDSGTEA